MNLQEKLFYQQIHPLKLFTDWSTGVVALFLLWRHHLRAALITAVGPSIIVSIVLIQRADLEPYKRSPFGRYVKRYMTRRMEALRFAGYLVMAVGAWYRRPVLLPAGLLPILWGWLRGVLVAEATPD